MPGKYFLLVLVLVVGVVGLIAIYIFAPPFHNSTTTSNSAHFTIYASERGFNNSADHTDPWPVMNVKLGQTVTIKVINNEPVEAHGFEIQHYFTGISLRPGQYYDVTFVADQAGTFRVYCNIFCAVHALMQNSQLVVSS